MTYPNWFEPYARAHFERFLLNLQGQQGLKFVQIGAFTGHASLWLLRNVLTGVASLLVDVDTWEGSDEPEHKIFDWSVVESSYDRRTRQWQADARLVKYKGTSEAFFKEATPGYDFIYVDGDHQPDIVFADGESAIGLLKPGGLLAFDDYVWRPHGGGPGPGSAVDRLSAAHPEMLGLSFGAQAWFRKR